MTLPRDVTQTLVDELILDYLLHTCITALLAEWDVFNASSSVPGTATGTTDTEHAIPPQLPEVSRNADRALLLVNAFLQIYQTQHPTGIHTLHRDVRFRLILCRFLSLFLRRIDPASNLGKSPQTSVLRFRKERRGRLQRFLNGRGLGHVFPNDILLTDFIFAATRDGGKGGCTVEEGRREGYWRERFGSWDEEEEKDKERVGDCGDGNGGEGRASFFQNNLPDGSLHPASAPNPPSNRNSSRTSPRSCSLPPQPQPRLTPASLGAPGSIRGTASLSDSLPLFMLLTAWTSVQVIDSPVTQLWIEIATSFMTNAFVEDFLCHGVPAVEAVSENFAWGTVPVGEREVEGLVKRGGKAEGDGKEEEEGRWTMDDWVVNEMFSADGGEVGRIWEVARRRALVELVPKAKAGVGKGGSGVGDGYNDDDDDDDGGGGGGEGAFERFLLRKVQDSAEDGEDGEDGEDEQGTGTGTGTGSGMGLRQLERSLCGGYITAVLGELSAPVLAQLERGRLAGVEKGEVERLLRRARAWVG